MNTTAFIFTFLLSLGHAASAATCSQVHSSHISIAAIRNSIEEMRQFAAPIAECDGFVCKRGAVVSTEGILGDKAAKALVEHLKVKFSWFDRDLAAGSQDPGDYSEAWGILRRTNLAEAVVSDWEMREDIDRHIVRAVQNARLEGAESENREFLQDIARKLLSRLALSLIEEPANELGFVYLLSLAESLDDGSRSLIQFAESLSGFRYAMLGESEVNFSANGMRSILEILGDAESSPINRLQQNIKKFVNDESFDRGNWNWIAFDMSRLKTFVQTLEGLSIKRIGGQELKEVYVVWNRVLNEITPKIDQLSESSLLEVLQTIITHLPDEVWRGDNPAVSSAQALIPKALVHRPEIARSLERKWGSLMSNNDFVRFAMIFDRGLRRYFRLQAQREIAKLRVEQERGQEQRVPGGKAKTELRPNK
ncbi:MAG: hypothetical protein C5B49_13455 [Bdellovibrio sp.]|nr:MAG: hypothetical protein C5B49_13455 [Bdellovibrio sp.]